MSNGFISLWRSLQDNPVWTEEKFTRGQAWVDLLLLANHETGYIRKRGIRVEIKRGEVGRSKETLADRWKWSRSKVTKFLSELEQDKMVLLADKGSKLLQKIVIVNYAKYQTSEQQTEQQNFSADTEEYQNFTEKVNNKLNNKRTSKEHQKDTNNKNNKNNKREKDTNVSKKTHTFIRPTLEEIKSYCLERHNSVDPEKWLDHYTSNGFKVGRNQMKDWKAAVRNWERSNGNGGSTSICKFCNNSGKIKMEVGGKTREMKCNHTDQMENAIATLEGQGAKIEY